MSPAEPLFPELFAQHPPFLQRALRSVLAVDALDDLYRQAQHSQRPLARSVLEALNIDVQVSARDLQRIPNSGPLLIVANHPHGMLDGLILDSVLSSVRPDLKLMVNESIAGLRGMAGRTIPVDVFSPGRNSVQAARAALRWLTEGKSLLLFPAGEVSHWRTDQWCVSDGPWSSFAAGCARRVRATVLPAFIPGQNSAMFSLAGLLHPALRTARLPRELFQKSASTVELRIGDPVSSQQLAHLPSDEARTAYLRARVYMMAHRPHSSAIATKPAPSPIFAKRLAPVAASIDVNAAVRELQDCGTCLIDTDQYAVYTARGNDIPLVVGELGRLRELTFRAVGEGSGKPLDCDEFDHSFEHLILWHKPTRAIAGAYRLLWTEDARNGIKDLYTSKLFRYSPEFLPRLGPAVELGRSFIVQEHQRETLPLFLLWQAIGRRIAARPHACVLFGAVSISTSYSEAARALMVDFLKHQNFRHPLDALVDPRRPFASPLIRNPELHTITRCLADVEDLPLADIGSHENIPVLLRHYLRLGGKVAAFNVDPKFSNALDALLILDLRNAPRRVLAKYMGAEAASAFLSQAAS